MGVAAAVVAAAGDFCGGAAAGVLAHPATALFVAEAEGRIVGMLTLAWYDAPSAARRGSRDVVVDAAVQGPPVSGGFGACGAACGGGRGRGAGAAHLEPFAQGGPGPLPEMWIQRSPETTVFVYKTDTNEKVHVKILATIMVILAIATDCADGLSGQDCRHCEAGGERDAGCKTDFEKLDISLLRHFECLGRPERV